jgi:hypothetical protein
MDTPSVQTAADLLGRFRVEAMARAPIVFTADEENSLHAN